MFVRSELAPNFDQSMQQGPKYHCRSYQRAARTQFQRMPFGAIVHWCCCPAETLKVQKITGICWRQSVWSSSWVGGEADKQASTVSDGIGKLGPNITFQAWVASNSGQEGGQVVPARLAVPAETKLLESRHDNAQEVRMVSGSCECYIGPILLVTTSVLRFRIWVERNFP